MKKPNNTKVCSPRSMSLAVSNVPQKRKTFHDYNAPGQNDTQQDDIFTSKPTAVFNPTGGRSHTLSIAVPGSIVGKYVFFTRDRSHINLFKW